MSMTESAQSNKRTRLPRQHRGWSARLRSPEQVARDIANSILSDIARPDAPKIRVPSEFTSDLDTLRIVDKLLAAER